ncbi:MAG: DUF2283 domain-containing protein [Candidatus Hatepunaea meridiana]|nr:DUF2283 domain-containing protein [Candidatus Hatepunaea meridiana]
MIFEYDSEADAAYIKIAEGEIADTREMVDGIILDYDAEGKVLGVEILILKSRGAKVWESREKKLVLQN